MAFEDRHQRQAERGDGGARTSSSAGSTPGSTTCWRLSRQAETLKQRLAAQQRQEIEDIFGEYLDWIQETMTTERQPWIKVICVLTGGEDANASA